MSNELDGRVGRLERAVAGLGIDLAHFDDPDQAAARAKVAEQAVKDAEKQADAAEKAAAKEATV